MLAALWREWISKLGYSAQRPTTWSTRFLQGRTVFGAIFIAGIGKNQQQSQILHYNIVLVHA